MTLSKASAFWDEDYLAVVDPQARPNRRSQTWIRRGEADIAVLDVGFAEALAGNHEISRGKLKVEQTGGSSFGYRVRLAADGEREDLSAFRIDVPKETAAGWIHASEKSAVFKRQVIAVGPGNNVLAICLALFPIMVLAGKGLASGLISRRST